MKFLGFFLTNCLPHTSNHFAISEVCYHSVLKLLNGKRSFVFTTSCLQSPWPPALKTIHFSQPVNPLFFSLPKECKPDHHLIQHILSRPGIFLPTPCFIKEKEREKSLSHVRLFATPWTIAYHAPLSMGFSKQEYWSGLPIPSPKDLLDPGIKPRSPALQADALSSEPPGKSSFIKTSPLLLRTNMFFIPLGINWARKRWSSRTCAV